MITFGSFQIDPRTWLLTSANEPIELSPRLVEILAFIVERQGSIVTKDELLERFWPDVHVSDNTLARAIADIRKALGEDASAPRYLETASRRGYRFAGSKASISEASDPFEDWVKGRLALDSLDSTRLTDAVRAFERAAVELPRYAPAHAGLANAYLLQYERTRSVSVPDRGLLIRAMESARQASSLDPSLGEAWAVLGYLLSASGKSEEGQAAARRATALEPDNWRHHYRLAYGVWGEERLRAVDHTLSLMPAFAPARMLGSMVFVARGLNSRAEREASIGADAQRQHQHARTPLPAVGFHWLRGMIVAARGDRDAALESFAEEVASAATGHVYAREFAVNAHVASGFTLLSAGNRDAASAAFAQALAEATGHPKASVGMLAIAVMSGEQAAIERARAAMDTAIAELIRGERHSEAALVAAGVQVAEGHVDHAVESLDRFLTAAPAGPAGWIIPIDPMLARVHESPGKTSLLAKLAARSA